MPRTQRDAAVHRSILIHSDVTNVFDALRSEARVREWYFDDAKVDFRPGGAIEFDSPEGVVRAEILEIVEPERVVVQYHPPWWGKVTWAFKPGRTGTRVHVSHEGFEGREVWIDRFAWGWESFLKDYKAHVEGRPIR